VKYALTDLRSIRIGIHPRMYSFADRLPRTVADNAQAVLGQIALTGAGA
jgi:hypothetical protein